MKTSNRDLLVLLKDETMSSQAIEQEVEQLNDLLFHIESTDTFCGANEIIDMNGYRILQDEKCLEQMMHQRELKPFIFLCNKN
ncbi:MAG TPA: hypothetical protein PLL71_07715 [Agriterribacter sp.]|nr:hypothetical protein [Agriterribacter sp.]